MTIEEFIARFKPCNPEELRKFATVAEAWEAETNPGLLMWACVCLADDPQQWRALLADLLTEYALPAWEAIYPDDKRVQEVINACRSGDPAAARAAARAAALAARAFYYASSTTVAYAARAAYNAARAVYHADIAISAALAAYVASYAANATVADFIKARATWVANYTENDTK